MQMSVGETAKLTCAPIVAYGVKGRPPKIPPNSTLVFRVELIAIKEKLQIDPDGFESDWEKNPNIAISWIYHLLSIHWGLRKITLHDKYLVTRSYVFLGAEVVQCWNAGVSITEWDIT